MTTLIAFLIRHLLRPRWVISEYNELSLKIWGVTITYYKRASPLIYNYRMKSRPIHHREFGEYIWADFKKQNSPGQRP